MSSQKTVVVHRGLGFCSLLAIALITAKLCGFTQAGWLVCTAPLWVVPAALAAFALAALVCLALFGVALFVIRRREERQRMRAARRTAVRP